MSRSNSVAITEEESGAAVNGFLFFCKVGFQRTDGIVGVSLQQLPGNGVGAAIREALGLRPVFFIAVGHHLIIFILNHNHVFHL